MRSKRTPQLTKEELILLVEKFDNNKSAISEHTGIGGFSLRSQLMRHGIYTDSRGSANKKRSIDIPSKEILIKHYFDENLTFVEIAELYDTSNVTVRKWFDHHHIKCLTHSETIAKKVIPKIVDHNLKNHGIDHRFRSEETKEQIRKTFIEKYGVPFHPIGSTSKAELDVLEYFNSINNSFKKAHKFGIELDGYSEDLNVAFEYCGLYWHKETNKGKLIHEKKYKICKENGIRLFTIFEDEWTSRNKQVKSFIKASLKVYDKKLFARKLKLKVLPKRHLGAIEFLNDYHIQGASAQTTTLCHYALYYGDDIVSVMTVGNHHRNGKEIVINRCCTKSNILIVGGSKRLFKAVVNDFPNTTIKTWSDNRWTEGYLYENLGFTLALNIPKDYSYVALKGGSSNIRKSKQSMTKKKLNAKVDQTEYQRALELGFDRIWDCGKKTWLFQT